MELAVAVDHLSALQGEHPAEAQLLGPVAVVEPYESDRSAGSSSGVNVTRLVVFADPDAPLGYFKPHSGLDSIAAQRADQTLDTPPLNECAAWHLARRLGEPYATLVAPSIYRWVEDGEGNEEPGSVSQERGDRPDLDAVLRAATGEVEHAGFFDCLIGQQDRHRRQHRWDRALGRLFLLDHGFAFPTPKARHRHTVLWDARVARAEALSEAERERAHALAASSDLLGVAPLLRAECAAELRRRAAAMAESGKMLKPKRL